MNGECMFTAMDGVCITYDGKDFPRNAEVDDVGLSAVANKFPTLRKKCHVIRLQKKCYIVDILEEPTAFNRA